MDNQKNDYNSSIVRISGTSIDELYFLANVYYEPIDPEDIMSMISTLTHKPNDIKWNAKYSHETWLTSMDQSIGGFLFAVSMEGELHSNRTGKWDVMNLDCPNGLNDVWSASDDEIFTVGLLGERVQLIGKSLNITRDDQKRRLNAVHGSSNKNVFTVGDEGLVYRFDGKNWIELEPATNYNLLAVLSLSETETYVAGTKGVLLKWNGNDWEWIDSPEITITSLAWYKNVLYVAAGGDGVFILGKNGLEKLKEVRLYRLRTINDFLFGVGNKLVARYNGTKWWGGDLDL